MWKLFTKWKKDIHNSPASCSAPGGTLTNLQLVSTTQRPLQHPFLGHRFPSLQSWTIQQPSATTDPFWGGTFGLIKATGYSIASRSAPLIRGLLAFLVSFSWELKAMSADDTNPVQKMPLTIYLGSFPIRYAPLLTLPSSEWSLNDQDLRRYHGKEKLSLHFQPHHWLHLWMENSKQQPQKLRASLAHSQEQVLLWVTMFFTCTGPSHMNAPLSRCKNILERLSRESSY